ncbi:MAG TPA: deaminase [Solirubrobacterales bacterium]|nr:deaminase [Solirubrobacterales bacterium]
MASVSDAKLVTFPDMNPPSSELVIGLVGAVGTDLELVCTDISLALDAYDYDVEEIRLSRLLSGLDWGEDLNEKLPSEPLDKHIWTHMDAGNALRYIWNRGDALALLALSEIAAIRADKGKGQFGDGTPESLERCAFILRSLKHPDEVELLRSIYGSRFVLISAYAPEEIRKKALTDQLTKQYRSEDSRVWFKSAERIIQRDEAETEDAPNLPPGNQGSAALDSPSGEDASSDDAGVKESRSGSGRAMSGPETADVEAAEHEVEIPQKIWGQNLRDTFHRADIFVDAREDVGLRQAIERVMAILFSHPFKTPNKDEYGLFAAEGASRQSAELGRQVGAAIATPSGDVIALGSNEVPKAGGGVYGESEAEGGECGIGGTGDGREFQNSVDTNDRMKREIAVEIVDELSARGFLQGESGEAQAPELLRALERTKLGDLIEFGRALHAEMDALMDAARRGVSVKGCTLYTTTFPCHNCARHIIGAGVMRVVYVSPYAKSQAEELHSDAIDFAKAKPREGAVQFEPFVGVAPRRYLDLFEASRRKDEDGHVIEPIPSEAILSIPDVELEDLRPEIPGYRQRETLALDFLKEVLETSGLGSRDEKGEGYGESGES